MLALTITGGVALLLAAVLLWRARVDRARSRALARALASCGARVDGTRVFPSFGVWGEWRGRAFEVAYVRFTGDAATTVSLRAVDDDALVVRILPRGSEGATPKLHEAPTGDAVLDGAYEVWTTSTPAAQSALASPALAARLLSHGGRVEVRHRWARLTETGDRFEARAVAEALDALRVFESSPV